MAEAALEKRKRRWPWVLLGAAVVLMVVVFGALTRLQAQPIPAGAWLTERLEAEVDGLLPDADLSFRNIRIGMDLDYHPQIYLDDVTLTRADGVPLMDLRSAQGDLSIGALLRGEAELRRIELSGAVLLVERASDGSLDFTLGESEAAEISGITSVGEALEGINALLESDGLSSIDEINAEGISVNYTDALSGETWIGDGGQMRFFRDGTALLFTAEAALLTGREELAALSLSMTRDAGSPDTTLALVIEDAAAGDIASQSPALAWLSVVDASVSGALRMDVDENGLSALSATLELGEGALRPNASTRPIPFSDALITLDFDPETDRLTFDEFRLDTAWGTATSQGSAQLQRYDGMFPQEIVGQFRVSNISANPGQLYEAPRELEKVSLDFRLRLDPFTLDIGQAVVVDDATTAMAMGRIAARPQGWDVAVDLSVNAIKAARAMEFWPVSVRPGLRRWFANNIIEATIEDATWAIRTTPGERPRISMTQHFSQGELQVLRTLPHITAMRGSVEILDDKLTVLIEEGELRAPQGGDIDVSGSVFHVADMRPKPATGEVRLAAKGTITGVLSVLDEDPFNFLTKANQPVTLADGQAALQGTIRFPMKPRIRGPEVGVDITAEMRNLRSDTLVRNKTLALPSARAVVTNERIAISGAGTLGRVAFDGVWVQPLGQPGVGSELRGTVELSPATLDEFNIELPPGSVTGEGTGELILAFPRGTPPEFTLTSDVQGVRLALAPVSWVKGAETEGRLVIEGLLGPTPEVTRLVLTAPGLAAEGRIAFREGGQGLQLAEFDRVDVGGWLTGGLTLLGRGPGVPPAVGLQNARLDLRRARFGRGEPGTGPPLDVSLTELIVTDEIVLTDVEAALTTTGGLSGAFGARVAGGAALTGRLSPSQHGASITIQSGDGGGVLRAAGIFRQVNGGDLALTLVPRPEDGTYDGTLDLQNIRVNDAPSIAALLSAVSVVGFLEQLDGKGLVFSDVEARFRLSPERVVVTESSAVGASLGLSLDGVFDVPARRMDFQGVISPVYLLNGIGSIFTRRGEGLVGFNFTLQGDAASPEVGVNPLSILTPGMFRDIFRRPPPEVSQ